MATPNHEFSHWYAKTSYLGWQLKGYPHDLSDLWTGPGRLITIGILILHRAVWPGLHGPCGFLLAVTVLGVFHQWGHPKSTLYGFMENTNFKWMMTGGTHILGNPQYKGGWDSPTVFHQLVLYLPIRPAVFFTIPGSLIPLGTGSPSSMELYQNVYQWAVENTAIRRGPPIRFQNCLAREVLPSKIGDVCKNNVNTQWNCPPSVVPQCDPSKQSCLRSTCNMSNNQTNILGRWVVYNGLQENTCCHVFIYKTNKITRDESWILVFRVNKLSQLNPFYIVI
jgi:hypothetical protein